MEDEQYIERAAEGSARNRGSGRVSRGGYSKKGNRGGQRGDGQESNNQYRNNSYDRDEDQEDNARYRAPQNQRGGSGRGFRGQERGG